VQHDLGSDSGDEERITTIGMQGKDSFYACSISLNESHDDDNKRSALFHIRVVSKHTKIDTLFDPGSQVNLISETLHSYICHNLLLFNPTSLDEVFVQPTHLERRGKNG
jgi:hypothetical protein